MNWLNAPCAKPHEDYRELAQARQASLTKPVGSLGRLETLAIHLSALQGRSTPVVEQVKVSIFAADHGVAAEGVSAFPQEVTMQMVGNFLQGRAAISVLASEQGARLEVVDVGILSPVSAHEKLVVARSGAGTANSAREAAMTGKQLLSALQAGRDAIERALHDESGVDLFIGGEMGIANTTTATALYCALLDVSPAEMTGAGTGLDDTGIALKQSVVERILALHQACEENPLEWLRCAGGFEIVALVGAYVAAAQQGLPVLVDGFISTAAALYALKINPQVRPWLLLSHVSAEQGHRQVLEVFGQPPLLDLGLRLGEGSGAAVTLPLLKLACALHNRMATFEEAAVANRLLHPV